MEQNKFDFMPFVEDDERWEEYITRMRKDAQWGGYHELVAASRLIVICLPNPHFQLTVNYLLISHLDQTLGTMDVQ